MAIKNEALEDFFLKSKVKNYFPYKEKNESASHRRFRVFDDPTIEKISEKSDRKAENKLETNGGQIGDKTEDKLESNRGQTGDNFKLKNWNRGQTGDRIEDRIEDKLESNRGQIEDKPRTIFAFSSLVGLQRKVIFFIYESSRISINSITPPISLQHLAECCKTTEVSVKKTIQRLERMGIILRIEFKIGRGGWTRYSLPENILQEIIRYETEDKLRTNWRQIEDKLGTELGTESRTSLASSSSNTLYKTTTTSETNIEQNVNTEDDWKKLDVAPLVEIGFSHAHLLQLAKQNLLEPTAVQESIYAFAFDLKKNDKAKLLKKSPIDFFMGILRHGSVYTPPPNYKSPKEIALEIFIEKQQRMQALEDTAMKLGFETWITHITPDEKIGLIPEETRKTGMSALMNQALRTHFREHIWPTLREDLMNPTFVKES